MCQLLLVVGSQNSSNSRRLVEVCEKEGVASHLIDDLSRSPSGMACWRGYGGGHGGRFRARESGSGTDRIAAWLTGYGELEEVEIKEEDVRFNLPSELSRTVQLHTIARYESQPSTHRRADHLVLANYAAGGKLPLAKQHRDGYWWADLTADTTLESDYILLELWRHPPVDGVWNPPARDRINRAVAFHPGAAVAGWRLQYLLARPFRD